MKLNLYIVITFFLNCSLHSQQSCAFKIMQDSSICGPSEVILWQKGSDLSKAKWFGNGFTRSDTLFNTSAQINKTSTFYATNRVLDSENLIKNGNFEQGNQGFTSKYDFSCLNGSMPPGSYCINKRTDTYWSSWSSCQDHTKQDGTGNMYITDGAPKINESIWCQTVKVDQNTNYALSTWITSVISVMPATLQFAINGEKISKSFTASSNECEWNEFFEIWNSELYASAEICITNENTAVDGNDFSMDDISFSKVCYQIDSVTIQVIDTFDYKLNNDTTICPGENILLHIDSNFSNEFGYYWSTGEIKKEIAIKEVGNYELTVQHLESGCSKSKSVKITQVLDPISSLSDDTTVCLSAKGGIELYAGDAKWYLWKHPNGTDSSKSYFATVPGYYEVTLYNGENCNASDRLVVDDLCVTELFIPNCFTPNGDGKNDTFGAEAIATYYYHLLIFNRMGKVVFETYDLNQKWTGLNAPIGTYAYWIEYQQISRVHGNIEDRTKIGSFVLLR